MTAENYSFLAGCSPFFDISFRGRGLHLKPRGLRGRNRWSGMNATVALEKRGYCLVFNWQSRLALVDRLYYVAAVFISLNKSFFWIVIFENTTRRVDMIDE